MTKKKRDENVYDEADVMADDDDIDYAEPTENEEIELEMHVGEREADVYSEEGLTEELDHDEIAPWEQGFMEGELEVGHMGECETCGKLITNDAEETYEREIDGVQKRFCSKRCLDHADD